MKDRQGLHRAQTSTLFELRHVKRARFSELLATTDMTSDGYKFHLRKLVTLGYVIKADDGKYVLTPTGKEFANRLNEKTGKELSQPKISMLLIVVSKKDGSSYYLAHKRKRQPFYEYWGIGSGPLVRGVSATDSASAELKKQSGIDAEFEYRGSLRVTDTNPEGEILEDKLFLLMYAELDGLVEPHNWHGGSFAWMREADLLQEPRLFPTTSKTLSMLREGKIFEEAIVTYTEDEY